MPRLTRLIFPLMFLSLPFLGHSQETVEFPSASPSKLVRAELYHPKGQGPFPAVVVLHSCGGVMSRDDQVAARLQSQGYVALVPDTFYQSGLDGCVRGKFKDHVKDQVDDTLGAAAYLRSLPFVKGAGIAVMGFSLGATAAVALPASSWDQGIRAAVSYYPICQTMRSKRQFFKDSKVPLLLLLAELDDWSPASVCVAKAKQMRQEGRTVEWKVYPGVHHAFDNERYAGGGAGRRNRTLAYDESAAADAWKRLLVFFNKYLRQKPK